MFIYELSIPSSERGNWRAMCHLKRVNKNDISLLKSHNLFITCLKDIKASSGSTRTLPLIIVNGRINIQERDES